MKKTTKLRQLLAAEAPILAPCAYNAMTARLVEMAGFPLAGATGNGIHGDYLGTPDNGLMTMTEMAGVYHRMCGAVEIPIMADAEAGYGNALNVRRTVQEFEQAGLAGIFIEDQQLPTNCPFIQEPKLVSVEEMCGKIQAAAAARQDPDFVICARSDAPFGEAVERAQAYLEAGADMIQIVPKTRQELEEVPKRVQAPLHVGFISRKPMYEGLTALDLGKMGYKIITFPQLLYYTAIKAQLEALGILRETSSDQALAERMIDMDFYLQVVQSEKYQAWQKKFIKE